MLEGAGGLLISEMIGLGLVDGGKGLKLPLVGNGEYVCACIQVSERIPYC